MQTLRPKEFLPVEVVFHANWWHKNYGISFGRDFFFDPKVRVESERRMRQALYERFGDIGLGEKDAKPRPVVGPVHLACGFIIPAAFGCQIEFFKDATPEVKTLGLSDDDILRLEPPDLANSPIVSDLISLMDKLQEEYGYLEGDIGWDGLQNTALYLRGCQLFLDYYDNPRLVRRLLDVIVETQIEFVRYIRKRTGTSSISINRIVLGIDPTINLHSNCTVQMISNTTYEEYLLKYEKRLAQELFPYGIHHCGNNMHAVAPGYSKVEDAILFDVGWGSDVEVCRKFLPDKIFSIRLSPIRMMTATPDQIEADLVDLLEKARPLDKVAICCINMDYGTPDENVRKIFEVAECYRRYGA